MSRRGKSTPLLSLHDLPAGKKALGQQVKEIKGNSWDDHKVMQFCESHDWDPKNIEDAISAMIENPQEEWKEYSKKKPRKKVVSLSLSLPPSLPPSPSLSLSPSLTDAH